MSGYTGFPGSGITEDTWANRAPGSATDGDWFQVTGGAVYRYSSTAGEFVRPIIYDGTVVLDAKLTGDVLPGAESPAWTTAETGGTIATDGTWLTFPSTSDPNVCNAKFDHGTNNANHFIQGFFHCTAPGNNANSGGRVIQLVDSASSGQNITFSLEASTANRAGWSSPGTTNIEGSQGPVVNFSTAHYVELIINATDGQLFAYLDNNETPYNICRRAEFTAANATLYGVGDVTSADQGTTLCKDALFGRW